MAPSGGREIPSPRKLERAYAAPEPPPYCRRRGRERNERGLASVGYLARGRSALNQTVKVAEPERGLAAKVAELAPGLALAGVVAFAASRLAAWETAFAQAWLGRPIAVAAPVIALLLGIAFHAAAARPSVMPGLTFAIKRVLRWAIALLGLNIALSDIIGLGVGTAVMVIVAMAATLISGLLFARLFGKEDPYGALAGAACAVCGASAALATVDGSAAGRTSRIRYRLRRHNHKSARDPCDPRLPTPLRGAGVRRSHHRHLSRRLDPRRRAGRRRGIFGLHRGRQYRTGRKAFSRPPVAAGRPRHRLVFLRPGRRRRPRESAGAGVRAYVRRLRNRQQQRDLADRMEKRTGHRVGMGFAARAGGAGAEHVDRLNSTRWPEAPRRSALHDGGRFRPAAVLACAFALKTR